jgi:hypothetical protein
VRSHNSEEEVVNPYAPSGKTTSFRFNTSHTILAYLSIASSILAILTQVHFLGPAYLGATPNLIPLFDGLDPGVFYPIWLGNTGFYCVITATVLMLIQSFQLRAWHLTFAVMTLGLGLYFLCKYSQSIDPLASVFAFIIGPLLMVQALLISALVWFTRSRLRFP